VSRGLLALLMCAGLALLAWPAQAAAACPTPPPAEPFTFTVSPTIEPYGTNVGVDPQWIADQFVGVNYDSDPRTITITGGTPPYTTSVPSPTIPAGVTVTVGTKTVANDLIKVAGTPSASYKSTLNISLQDANGCSPLAADARFDWYTGIPPSNNTPPSISGTPAVGQQLACNPGNWTQDPNFPITETWTWLDENDNVLSGPKTGDEFYTVQSGDTGHSIRCRVRATQLRFGFAEKDSQPVVVPCPAPSMAAPLSASFTSLAESSGCNPSADVEVTLGSSVDAHGASALGTQIHYVGNVRNNGPNAATAVSLTFALAPQIHYDSGDSGCTPGSGGMTVTCSIGDLPKDGEATVKVNAVIDSAGNAPTIASAASPTPDPNHDNNTAEDDYLIVGPCPGSALTIDPASLDDGVVGTDYNAGQFPSVRGTGGSGDYTLSLLSDLPPGFDWTSDVLNGGILSGTPTRAGSYMLAVAVKDEETGCTATKNVALKVTTPAHLKIVAVSVKGWRSSGVDPWMSFPGAPATAATPQGSFAAEEQMLIEFTVTNDGGQPSPADAAYVGQAEGDVAVLVSRHLNISTLQPGETQTFQLRVVPSDLEQPPGENEKPPAVNAFHGRALLGGGEVDFDYTIDQPAEAAISDTGAILLGGTVITPPGLPPIVDEVEAAIAQRRPKLEIMRVVKPKCQWIAGTSAKLKSVAAIGKVCGSPVWIKAKVKGKKWSLRFKHPLPRGRYVLYTRVLLKGGVFDPAFSSKSKNRRVFTVR
jgi:hypothetical protein